MVLFDAQAAYKLGYDEVMKEPFTKVHGKPTLIDLIRLEKEACARLARVDMPYPTTHGRKGLLGAVMDAEEYTEEYGLVYEEKNEPLAYPEGINEDTPTHERKRAEAECAQDNDAYNRQLGAYDAVGDLFRAAVGASYFVSLKDEYTGWAGVHPRRYITVLKNSRSCKPTTKTQNLVIKHYERGWKFEEAEDLLESLREYGIRLERERKAINRHGVGYDEERMKLHYATVVKSHPELLRTDFQEANAQGDDLSYDDLREYWEGVFDNMEEFEETRAGTAKKEQFESAAYVRELQRRQIENQENMVNFVAQAEAQQETVQAVQSGQNEVLKLLKEMKAENELLKTQVAGLMCRPVGTGIGAPLAQLPPPPGIQANVPGCKYCGGMHHVRPHPVTGKIRSEEECGGKGWPASAHKKMPKYFIDKMNALKGTNVTLEELKKK